MNKTSIPHSPLIWNALRGALALALIGVMGGVQAMGDPKGGDKGAKPVATKVAIDQILWNPVFGCMLFTYLTVYDGGSFPQVLVRIQQSLATQVTGSWGFWGPAHAINFRFVPSEQRLLYINVLQVIYNVFLSVISAPPQSAH